jgi:hypothetical protein
MGEEKKKNYVLSNNKKLSFHMGYVPLYMIRGDGYFF